MLKLLRYLWFNEDGFFGIGQGPSSQEKQQYGELGALANFATGEGEKDILSADNFWKAILSGDPMQMSKVLGPQISGINKRGQEEKKTASEFGNRSGGTNAAMQMAGDKTRSEVDEMISSLTGHAAGALGASGGGLLAAGVGAHQGAFQEADVIHQQRAAQLNDLFKSITSVASSFLPGKFGAAAGGLSSGGGGGAQFTPESGSTDPYTIYS